MTGCPSWVVFTGVFDGNNKMISNITITATDGNGDIGLFIEISGTVQNLILQSVSITNNDTNGTTTDPIRTGSLAGLLSTTGKIKNVGIEKGDSSSLGVVAADDGDYHYVGGLVGENQGSIADSYARVKVNGGGVANANGNGNGNDDYVGGLVGSNANSIHK